MIVGLLSLLAVLVLAFLRVPLAFALLSVSLGGIGVVMGWDVARSLVPLTISEAVFSYELAVVPMFILMGNILARTGIRPHTVRLLAAGTIPRTSSGKLRRNEALRRFLAGELDPPAKVSRPRILLEVLRSAFAFARARGVGKGLRVMESKDERLAR